MKWLFACLVLSLLVFGCAQQQPAANPPSSPPQAANGQQPPAGSNQQPANPPPASAATVEISGFAFSPSSLEVSAGTAVTWKNKDSVPHTATGDNGEFDTGTIPSGGQASHTFSTPGTYAYHCSVHSSMKATVVVK